MHCVHRKDPKWREYRDCSPGLFSKMADSRVSSWKEDDLLKGALQKYVKQGLKREEAIDFLRRDFPQYAWSIRTLDRRLRHFEVYYRDDTIQAM